VADIFISYKSERRPAVTWLAGVLDAYGFSVWFDSRLNLGANYPKIINREVRAARAVMVLWCPRSIESDWVIEEALMAKKCGNFVPIFMASVDPPAGFLGTHTFDLSGWDGDPQGRLLQDLVLKLTEKIGHKPISRADDIAQMAETWRQQGPRRLVDYPLDLAGQSASPLPELANQTVIQRILNILRPYRLLLVACFVLAVSTFALLVWQNAENGRVRKKPPANTESPIILAGPDWIVGDWEIVGLDEGCKLIIFLSPDKKLLYIRKNGETNVTPFEIINYEKEIKMFETLENRYELLKDGRIRATLKNRVGQALLNKCEI